MNVLEDVPFQTPVSLLGVEVQMTSPEMTAPDCHQIMQETEVIRFDNILDICYSFIFIKIVIAHTSS